MSAVIEFQESKLPPAVQRRGISDAQWRTMMNNLFPGAKGESVLMVWDYCVARKLDPLKKPCHIVPIKVRVGEEYVTRDVVMPGIYEYRTTAIRTGFYMGHSKPEYGPDTDCLGVRAPEWCSITIYRWSPAAACRIEFPVTVYFSEAVATKKDWKTKEITVNERWSKAPRQMLTKCAEAAGLREAFPDELGGEPTADEMEGQQSREIALLPASASGDPRGDTSNVDWELRDKHVAAITDILAEYGSDEQKAPWMYRQYMEANLREFPELWITVDDKLAADGIISKAVAKKYMKAVEPIP